LPHFEANGFVYWFYTTAQVTASFSTSGDLGLSFEWGGAFRVHFGGEVDTTTIGINLVAALALYALYHAAPTPPAQVGTGSVAPESGPVVG
jgi:hypothetical protein